MARKKLNNERTVAALKTEKTQEDFFDTSWQAAGSFGIRVSKTGRKDFFLFYTVGGIRRRYTLTPEYPRLGLAEAKQKAISLMGKVADGKDPGETKARHRGAATVSVLFDSFMQQKEKTFARSTICNYRAMWRKDCEPVIGHMKADFVRKGHIIEILDSIELRTDAPHMVNRTRTMLMSFFNWGIAKDRCQNNPVLSVPKAQKRELPGERFLSRGEIKIYWECTENLDVHERVFFRLLLLLALRPGEVKKLRWEWIDGDVLTLPGSEVKNKRELKLNLTETAQAEIALLKPISADSDFLFPGLTGKSSRRFFGLSHDRLLKAMDISDWTPRDIRRTCETQMRTFIRDSEGISRVLNHDVSSIRRTYDKGDYFARKRDVLTQWSNWIISLVSGAQQKVVNLR